MLLRGADYQSLIDDFEWQIPASYNMGLDVCDRWVAMDPDRTAIIDLTGGERRDVSFAELKRLSDQLAVFLKNVGVAKGDRIGVFRSQSVWTAATHIAVWKLGAISIPLFKLFGEEALASRLSDSGALAVVTDNDGAAGLRAIGSRLPALKNIVVPEQLELPDSAGLDPVDTLPDDPALLIYTSGTTGAPKGALHGHRVLLGHLPGVEISHDFLPQVDDVLWTPADWAWIGGLLDVLMPGLHHGVPVVAARMDKFSTDGCIDIIKKGSVRNVFFPPTALKMIKADGGSIRGLRSIASGGEPLGDEVLEWGRSAFGLTINEFYGQTECNMVVSSCHALFESKTGSMGRAVPGHRVAVIDQAGNRIVGEEGDIAIGRDNPVMMLEYWNNPQATREKFRGDWLLTGDRGIVKGDDIWFVGRDDDVITSSGYRIGPAEIEGCLLTHPAVAMVGVVGKPDKQRTEIVKAYVVLKRDFVPSEALKVDLQSHVKERLARYEYPREVEFLDELPMTITGKTIRKELRLRALAQCDR